MNGTKILYIDDSGFQTLEGHVQDGGEGMDPIFKEFAQMQIQPYTLEEFELFKDVTKVRHSNCYYEDVRIR